MTTTDPFTEAELTDYARAEAETRWPQRRTGHYVQQLAFVAGAEWARTHLAAQAPTDAEKDAAMDALGCELRVVENGQSTCDLHGGYATSDDVCEVVEVSLSAVRAARRDEEKR